MKNQQLPAHHRYPRRMENEKLSVAVIILSYAILLAVTYSLGYLVGSSFSIKDITTFVISKTSASGQRIVPLSFEPLQNKLATHSAEPVSSVLVRRTVIDRVYNGTSPYEDFIPPRITSSSLPRKIKGWGLI